jgi:hypothetical protein
LEGSKVGGSEGAVLDNLVGGMLGAADGRCDSDGTLLGCADTVGLAETVGNMVGGLNGGALNTVGCDETGDGCVGVVRGGSAGLDVRPGCGGIVSCP